MVQCTLQSTFIAYVPPALLTSAVLADEQLQEQRWQQHGELLELQQEYYERWFARPQQQVGMWLGSAAAWRRAGFDRHWVAQHQMPASCDRAAPQFDPTDAVWSQMH